MSSRVTSMINAGRSKQYTFYRSGRGSQQVFEEPLKTGEIVKDLKREIIIKKK